MRKGVTKNIRRDIEFVPNVSEDAFDNEVKTDTIQCIHDIVNGKEVLVHFNDKEESAYITDLNNEVIPSTTLFWFAWAAFHPDTELYKKGK